MSDLDSVAFLVCSAPKGGEILPGRTDYCKDCGKPIFITDGCEEEILAQHEDAKIRAVCDVCGVSRFGDRQVNLTPFEEVAIKLVGGDELMKRVEETPVSEIPALIAEFKVEEEEIVERIKDALK